MRYELPPDRDPVLRAAIGQDQAGQLAQLWAMFGEQPPATLNRSPEPNVGFTHYGATVEASPQGGLTYRPMPIALPPVDAHATSITFAVDHGGLQHRRAPRRATPIAQLQHLIATALPFRGTHTIPIRCRPAEWTAENIEWVARRLSQFLPPAETPGGTIALSLFGCSNRGVRLSVFRTAEEHGFQAWCLLSPIGPRKALDDWRSYTGSGVAVIGSEPLTQFGEPIRLAGPTPAERDDDDLDAIEKAARKRLHGDKAIPAASQPRSTPERRSAIKQPIPTWLAAIDWTDPRYRDPIEIGRQLRPLYLDLVELVKTNPNEARESLRIVGEFVRLFTVATSNREGEQ